MSEPFAGVALVAPVSFGYSRFSERSATWFAAGALREMLRLAGIERDQVDGLALASFSLPPDTAPSVCDSLGLSLRWLAHLPFGGASGVIAAKRAARVIQAGDAEIIACIGADTLAPADFEQLIANFSNATRDASYPYAGGGPNLAFALLTQAYMETYGTSREDFGRICVEQRYNANHCGHALFADKRLDLEHYLNARPVVEPLHLFDCVMPCAGADGFLIMSTERADALGLDSASLAAAFECFNLFPHDAVQLRSGWHRYGQMMLADAGIDVADIDIVETYDDYPVVVMLQLEGMGFCAPGGAAELLAERSMKFDGGGLPHNTSGGQLSVGQAGAAGGFLGIVEGLRQILAMADGHQVTNVSNALITGYGMVNYDRGLCSSAAVLTRNSR